MAEQQGLLTYSGKLGETIGYRRGGKHFERAKPRSYEERSRIWNRQQRCQSAAPHNMEFSPAEIIAAVHVGEDGAAARAGRFF